MTYLSFFLRLKIFATKDSFEGLLAHEHQLVVRDAAGFIRVLGKKLSVVVRALIMQLGVVFSIVI